MNRKCPFILRLLPVASAILGIALVGILFWQLSVIETTVLEPHLRDARAPELRRQTSMLQHKLRAENGTLAVDEYMNAGDYASLRSGKYWQVTTEMGLVLLRSPSLGQGNLPKSDALFGKLLLTFLTIPVSAFWDTGSDSIASIKTVQLERGKVARLLIVQTTERVPVPGREPQILTVRFAEDIVPFMERFYAERNTMLIVAAVVMLLLTVLSFLTVAQVRKAIAGTPSANPPL